MTGDVSGIVLAGGRSSRFGRSKLDELLDGRSVLERTIDRLRPVCAEILVVGRSRRGARANRSDRPGVVRFIPDPRPFEGPAAGLVAGLAAATGGLAVVVGGDMPLLRPGLLRNLCEALAATPATDAVALEEGGALRPLPLVVRRDRARAVADAMLARGDRSLRGVVAGLAARPIPEAHWRAIDPEADSLVDIDDPADLERVRDRILRGGDA
jgi:molybdenum cofactor guanylyltransferase